MPGLHQPPHLLPAIVAAGLAAGSVATAADPFTIAVIGDQQWPSRTLAIYPSFTAQTDWLAANAQAENLRFVTQVGDIVEHGNSTDQWNRAEAAMATLDSATNADGGTGGVTDALFLLTRNFIGTAVPSCLAACDVNGDGDIGGVTDAIALLTFNFLGGIQIPQPFPSCGTSDRGTDRSLGCGTAEGCPQ